MNEQAETNRQLNLAMLMLSTIKPGCVCLDSRCPEGIIPHMANDGGNHPHPYGLISDKTHEWRPKRRSLRIWKRLQKRGSGDQWSR